MQFSIAMLNYQTVSSNMMGMDHSWEHVIGRISGITEAESNVGTVSDENLYGFIITVMK